MANEYICFDPGLGRRFVDCADSQRLDGSVAPDRTGGEYDRLMDPQSERDAMKGSGARRNLMDVACEPLDSQRCIVRLPAALDRRRIAHFSFEKIIHALVVAIAADGADPQGVPRCRSS